MTNQNTPSAEATCSNCNGKGYNTRCFDEIGHEDFGGDGYKKRGLIEKVPCKKCSSAGEGKILTGEQSPFLAPSSAVQNPEEMMKKLRQLSDTWYTGATVNSLLRKDWIEISSAFEKMFKDCCVMYQHIEKEKCICKAPYDGENTCERCKALPETEYLKPLNP